jgi:hypothetical protein
VIDQITDALGDKKAFATAAVLALAALLGGLVAGELASVATLRPRPGQR